TGIQSVRTDTATGSTVYLREGKIHGENQQAGDRWEASVGPEAQLAAAGGAIVYVRVDDSIRAYNVLTGEVAEAYDPSGSGNLTVPEIIAPSGAALLHAGEQRYLATTLPGEDVDVTGRGRAPLPASPPVTGVRRSAAPGPRWAATPGEPHVSAAEGWSAPRPRRRRRRWQPSVAPGPGH